MASYISQVNIGGTTYPVGSMLYGVCSTTNPEAAAKTVTCAAFDTLATGVTIHVKFTTANTNTSPTLAVGSTEAKPITNPGGNLTWSAGSVISFTYDGTNWIMNDGRDTHTSYDTLTQTEVNTGTDTTGKLVTAKVIKDTVTNAINNLDGGTIGTAGAGKTITSLSQANGNVSATFGDISITKSQVSDLGTIGAAAAKGVDTSISSGSSSTNLPTSAAVASYVQTATAGITGAMHFKGVTTTELTDGTTTAKVKINNADYTPTEGDVVLYSDKEFVWTGTLWELLGDEGSYALKTNTASVVGDFTFTTNTKPTLTITSTPIPNVTSAGTAPSLTVTDVSIPNVTAAGSASSYSVSGGTLTLKPSVPPTLGTAISVGSASGWKAGTAATLGDPISVGSASGWNAGSQASITNKTSTTVVIP